MILRDLQEAATRVHSDCAKLAELERDAAESAYVLHHFDQCRDLLTIGCVVGTRIGRVLGHLMLRISLDRRMDSREKAVHIGSYSHCGRMELGSATLILHRSMLYNNIKIAGLLRVNK